MLTHAHRNPVTRRGKPVRRVLTGAVVAVALVTTASAQSPSTAPPLRFSGS
jgi:hypothetical protein